jgi:hypothetical protein
MAWQDLTFGNGVAVIDPHGDLIDRLIPHLPPERWDDVVLFDPADEEFAVAFNPLAPGSGRERDLRATDFIAVMKRHTSGWGDQMSSLLGNAVLAFLHSERGGTLPELRRFLVDPAFRTAFLKSVTHGEVLHYWEHEASLANRSAVGSIVTRLDELLRYESLLHLLGQRANRLDFADILDSGKIFLARLSKGQIGATNAFLLGSLLVARFHQTAIARQARNPAERPPYFLILDEAAELLTGTVAEILTGARKYGLGLTLAHQHLGQLRPEDGVRGAVLGSCATRVCFRVDGEDARKLADEFAGFGPTDLMNLPDRQAIARLGPRDTACNLETIFVPTPPRTYSEVYPEILARTRARYCTPRAEIRAQLAELRSQIPPRRDKVDPFAKLAREKEEVEATPGVPTASEAEGVAEAAPEPPVALPAVAATPDSVSAETEEAPTPIGTDDLTDPPLTAGAASAKSEAIKTTIIQQAGGWQFSHTPEVKILDGLTRIDLVLSLLNVRVACQISYTSTKELEVTNLFRILEAGYDPVFLVCDATVRRRAIEALFQSRASAEQRRRVQFLTCRQFLREIWQLGEAELRRSAVAGALEPLKAAPEPPTVTGDERVRIHRENLRRIQDRKQQAQAKSTLG